MNPLAEELNATITETSPALYSTLSRLGRELFYPKGILTQTAEAREKAHRYDATIGIARQGGHAMNLKVVMDHVSGLAPDQVVDYAPSMGNPSLRARWKEEMYSKNPSMAGKKVSLPVVTSGITHGLTIAGELFLDPQDIVVMPDKAWGNYNMIYAVRRQAEIRRFPLYEGDRFNTDGLARALGKALDEKGKAFTVLNFPNNPTGYSLRKDEVDRLVEALVSVTGEGRDLVVVLDDAYFGLFYTPEVLSESLFGRLGDASEHIFGIKLDGATKEEYAWGLRVGFITYSVKAAADTTDVYTALEKKTGGTIRGNISNCSQLSQSLVLAAMSDPSYAAQKEEKYELMKARAERALEVLKNPEFDEFWTPYPFNAGYFMSISLKDIDAEKFRVKLLNDHGVGVIAEGATDIRVAFSCLEVDEVADLFDIMLRCAREIKELQT
jgi:aspartate/methionine/tyrosine aminotransferase